MSKPSNLEREDWSGSFKTPEAALQYILAGNSTTTLRSLATGTRYTYKVTRVKDEAPNPRLPFPGPKAVEQGLAPRFFVSLLSGPNNEDDFTYIGMVKDNVFRLTKKSRMTSDSAPVRAFTWVLERLMVSHMPGNIEIWHEGRCGRCGRKLTVPESVAAGIGPECAERMGL